MPIPPELGLRRGWIYEVAATTLGRDGPHAAPIGVSTPDGVVLRAELYKGSATLANILENGLLGLNFPPGPALLQTALHHRDRLRFAALAPEPPAAALAPEPPATPRGVPFLEGADAWLELRGLRTEDAGRTVRLEASPGRLRAFGPVRLVNRAEGLLLESLVLSTRLHLMPPGQGRERLKENARVVTKVAPGSELAAAMGELLAALGLSS
ncbi:MAG: DUF447 domain-containing protein [Solidesulfovibrio sp. DCME]|uniref:DUF447 domain-containing protein n=1 Tax=Solidesulfovibrio sp. DCME TaxID=3447380 RepID=UPI003D0CC901